MQPISLHHQLLTSADPTDCQKHRHVKRLQRVLRQPGRSTSAGPSRAGPNFLLAQTARGVLKRPNSCLAHSFWGWPKMQSTTSASSRCWCTSGGLAASLEPATSCSMQGAFRAHRKQNEKHIALRTAKCPAAALPLRLKRPLTLARDAFGALHALSKRC